MKTQKQTGLKPKATKMTPAQLIESAVQAEQAEENRKLAMATAKHTAALQAFGKRIIEKVVETGAVYLELCEYIRTNQVPPKLVSFELTALGMNRQQVSRINTVANASDEVYSQFSARTLGFNKVLDLAVAEKGTPELVVGALAKSMGQSVIDVKAIIEEHEDEESEAPQLIPPTPEQKEAKFLKQFEQCAAKVLSAAAGLGVQKQRKVVGGNGYVLVVMRDKKWVAPAPAPAPAASTQPNAPK